MAHVATELGAAAPAERRRSPRRRLCLDANVKTPAGSTVTVVVHELSRSGFLMETAGPFSVGEPLQLRLPERGGVPAQVVWTCGRHFGCEFQRPLSSAAVSTALLKARPARERERLPRRIRLESHAENEVSPTTPSLPRRQLPLILGLSVLLWAVIAAALFYAS